MLVDLFAQRSLKVPSRAAVSAVDLSPPGGWPGQPHAVWLPLAGGTATPKRRKEVPVPVAKRGEGGRGGAPTRPPPPADNSPALLVQIVFCKGGEAPSFF